MDTDEQIELSSIENDMKLQALLDRLVIIELDNGLKVGNFSSPHDFIFEDNSILPAVSDIEADRLSVTFNEELSHNITRVGEMGEGDGCKFDLVKLSFSLSHAVFDEMISWMILQRRFYVDVVLCPLPMVKAIEEQPHYHNDLFFSIRRIDRLSNRISCSKFCL